MVQEQRWCISSVFFFKTFFQQIAHANILVQGEIIFRLTIDPALIAGSMGDVITYFVALRSLIL